MILHSITATYPEFQALPKGVKQMLLVSESVFFEDARGSQQTTRRGQPPHQMPVEAIHLARAGSRYESAHAPVNT
jgi:hypothetical protein